MSQLQYLSKRFSQESIDYAVSNLTEKQQNVLYTFLTGSTYMPLFVSLKGKGEERYSKEIVSIYNGLEDSDFVKLVDVFSKFDTSNKQALFILRSAPDMKPFMFPISVEPPIIEKISSDTASDAILRHNLDDHLSEHLKEICSEADVIVTIKKVKSEIKIDKIAEVIEVMSKHHLSNEQFEKLITTSMKGVDSLEQVVSNIGKYGEPIKTWSASIGELLSYEYPDTTLVKELSSPQE